MSRSIEKALVRVMVAIALAVAVIAFAFAPVPKSLPAVALEQPSIYRLEVALLAFYGGLLVATPAASGLIRGRLPTEISTRGARFAEEANHSDQAAEAATRQLEQTVDRLASQVTAIEADIHQLQRETKDDCR
jgi:hypothetical protein